MIQIYPRIALAQLPRFPDGEFVCVRGRFYRHFSGTFLQHQGHKLKLHGEPFSWLPPQGMEVQVTGELLRGKQAILLLHDCRPVEVGQEDGLPYPDYTDAQVGDQLVLLAHTRNIGDTQIAVTSTGASFVLVGRELDERKYALQGELLLLDPPTLQIVTAVPLNGVNSMPLEARA